MNLLAWGWLPDPKVELNQKQPNSSISQHTPPPHFARSPILLDWITSWSYKFDLPFLHLFIQVHSLRGVPQSHWFWLGFKHKVEETKEIFEYGVDVDWGYLPYTELPLPFQESSWIVTHEGFSFPPTVFLLQKLSVNVLHRPGTLLIVWNMSSSSEQ